MTPLTHRSANRSRDLMFCSGLMAMFWIVILTSGKAFAADGMATKAISGGSMNSVAVRNDGTIWAWGHNEFGESGNSSVGVSSAITNPVMMSASISNVVAVASGGWDSSYFAHTLILKSDGTVYASGANKFGQLGNGSNDDSSNLVAVASLSNIVAIAAGGRHSLALKADGTVWCWGANDSAQTGNGNPSSSEPTPLKVNGLTGVIAIAAGLNHSLALKSDGTVWGWGGDGAGQVGDGKSPSMQKTPVQATNLANVIAIAAGGKHSMALKTDGTVWCWGDNSDQECGIGHSASPQIRPVQAKFITHAVAIAAGGFHCLALDADGTIWTWGQNNFSQAISTSYYGPKKQTSLSGIISIAAGEYHSLAISSDGRVIAWGYDYYGQVGEPAQSKKKNHAIIQGPTWVDGLAGFALGIEDHTLKPAVDGTLWASGYNGFGQLGNGSMENEKGVGQVPGLHSVVAAAPGGGHSLALNSDGTVLRWGNNNFGEVGDGTLINRLSPVTTNIIGVAALASGSLHSLALKTNGTILSWGANSYGQLGDGTFTNRSAPVTVTNLSNVSMIAAGGEHSLALLSNQTVVAWGGNSSGQIGDQTTLNRYGFTAVKNLANVTAIAAGGQHSLAISNGAVWSWGNNVCGQLGDGTTINRSNAVAVVNLPSTIAAIAAGDNFSVALSSNGIVWVWGYNTYGQLGVDGQTNMLVPIRLSKLPTVKTIEAEGNSLKITMVDGTVQALGANICGQLGDGSSANNLSYVISPQYESPQLTYPWLAATNRPAVATSVNGVHILRADGTIWTESKPPNEQVLSLVDIRGATSIAAGSVHMLATKRDGTLWAWGDNSQGELGLGDVVNRDHPTIISSLTSVRAAEAGYWYSMAVLSNGTVQAWGSNNKGQLGIGNNTDPVEVPTQVPGLTNIIAVSCGYIHSLALGSDGKVWAWGANGDGQLGLGDTTAHNSPVQVTSLTGVAIGIAAGENCSFALMSDGSVYAWGDSGNGRLGLGSSPGNTKSPLKINTLTNICQIRTGSRQGFALDTNGIVWAWGQNVISGTSGDALGVDSQNVENSPIRIVSLSNVVYLAVGSPKLLVPSFAGGAGYPASPGGPQTAAAICADGSVWRWGIPWGLPAPVSSYLDFALTNDCVGTAPYPGAYVRGNTNSADFASFVIPLDFQTGKQFANTGGDAVTLFPFLTNAPVGYHYSATDSSDAETNLTLRFAYQNPIVAFGSRPGGSTLYTDRSYKFITYGGIPTRFFDFPYLENYQNSLKIEVYSKTDYSLIGIESVSIPNPLRLDGWTEFLTNGVQTTIDAYGLVTTVSTRACPDFAYGVTNGGVVQLSQTAHDVATNYIYVIKVKGLNSRGWVSLASDGTPSWQPLYTLEFNPAPPNNVKFLTQVQYDGEPLPPFYNGKTVDELMTNSWPVTNVVQLAHAPSYYVNLDQSPELRRHPILDNFADELKHDPLAIARFVQNEIELTDALDSLGSSNQIDLASLKLSGVNRGALGTFLERQGSPVEQCALLIYLLRQAGVPAVYVFPTNNGVKMFDRRLSKMLGFQLHNALDQETLKVNTNALISINYPWVAAYINNSWIHLFPWIKDTEIVQGPDVYDFLPEKYNSALKWCVAYIYNDPAIISLGDPNDIPERLFPRFVNSVLATNAAGVSYDDFGVRVVNRQKAYNAWDEFPKPTWVAATNLAAESLSDATVTNLSFSSWNPSIFPTNIFNTVEIIVKTNGANLLDTGLLRACDFHDRPLLLYHERTNSGANAGIASKLYLAPFRPDKTNVYAFNEPDLLNTQVLSNLLSKSTKDLEVTIRLNRYRTTGESTNGTVVGRTFHVQNGDLNALCLEYGRVTKQMLEPLAATVWNIEYKIRQNPSITNSLTADQYEGPLAYLMGMAYYEKINRFTPDLVRLNGTSPINTVGIGTGKLVIQKDDSSDGVPSGKLKYAQPCVDMFTLWNSSIAMRTSRPDSSENWNFANDGFSIMSIVDGSAKEHDVINSFFQQDDAISTVKLLQLTAERHAQDAAQNRDILVVNQSTAGALSGYADSEIATSTLQAVLSSPENQAYLTPGKITNNTSSYLGAGALVLDRIGEYKALISGSAGPANGGFGSVFPSPIDLNASSLGISGSGDYTLGLSLPSASYQPLAYGSFDRLQTFNVFDYASHDQFTYSSFDQQWAGQAMGYMNPTPGGAGLNNMYAANVLFSQERGFLGYLGDALGQIGSALYDPVHAVTGEFYVDTVDLNLVGPLPLEIRRNYSSLNTADNQFGRGWKLSFIPYISVATNESVIYVAEPNGSVLAYEPYGNTSSSGTNWQPTLTRNPQLVNNRNEGIGSTANLFLTKVAQTNSDFFVYSPNGDVRDYRVTPFSIPTSTNVLDLTRPYLVQWSDNRGNTLKFTYGINSNETDYAELKRVDSSSGAYIQFRYDIYGHIVDALAGDGRDIKYNYDEYGDLINVVLPDASQVNYEYEHDSQSVTNKKVITQQPCSLHLMTKEIKPEGRIIANVYDDQRRVISQASTVGPDLTLVTNALFAYSNDFVLTNSVTNTISGTTVVTDVFGKTTTYGYTKSRITNITDSLGQTVQQIWYDENTNQPGYYPRSVWKNIDKRGLTNEFRYDAFGNITNTITTGTNLTGVNVLEIANQFAAYNTNNLPIAIVDAIGNSNVIRYDPVFYFQPKEVVFYKGGQPIATNEMFYSNSSNAVTFGNKQWTNFAFGMPTMRVAAYNSPDAATNQWFYDGGGFITNQISFTSTGDPAITNSMFYNARGQLFKRVDGAGRICRYDYDALGRKISDEEFEAGQSSPLTWQYYYYNGDGDLTWYDGPQFDPEDYIWYDYDGAGRKTAEVHWRSRAKADGSGVEAETGDNIYSITSYEYDAFGNLIKQIDPVGNYSKMYYDAIGQMTQQVRYAASGSPLATNQMSYEPGGQVTNMVNSLGGVTRTSYTKTGKPYLQQNADGSTNGWRYDLLGRVTQEFQPNGSYWQTTYDDANRTVTRQFKDSGGTALATTTTVFDRRGNTITNITEEGAVFYSVYDGQNRLKVSGGPATVAGVSTQQVSYIDYDMAGVYMTNRDSLGMTKLTRFDAAQRPVSVQVFDSLNGNALVSAQTTLYSSNRHGVTVTMGSGSGSISNTTFLDSFGQTVLAQSYPSSTQTNFAISRYDVAERLVQQQDELQQATTFTYDGFGNIATKQLPDGATVTNSYNSESGLTGMSMPGGLSWVAAYNPANQRIFEKLTSGASVERQFTNVINASGAFAGLIQKTIDLGRLVTNSFSYDSFRRMVTNSAVGVLTAQTMVTAFQYDRQGLITNYIQSSGVNPTTSIARFYDGYKQLTSEQVAIWGVSTNAVTERWTAAGRRSTLSFGTGAFDYRYRVDGMLSNIVSFGTTYTYVYGNNGLLQSRSDPWRIGTINQRDGRGRVTQQTATIGGNPVFSEILGWRADSTMSLYQASRLGTGAWTNNNSYQYNARGQLTNEPFAIVSGSNAAYAYAFDTNKLGVRVAAQLSGGLTNSWQATQLANSHEVAAEKWQQSGLNLRADGSSGNANSLSIKLDGSSKSFALSGGRWTSDLTLTPGSHTLTAAGTYTTGTYTNTATSVFLVANTNSVTNFYDNAGNVTNRFFGNGKTQLLTWDAAGRLVAVAQRENPTNGFNWTAIYDALGRRLRTTQTPVVNNLTNSVMTLTLDSYYDPHVEFGEIGVAVNGLRTWKVTGPDLDGVYGSFQGVGGLEATVTETNGIAFTTIPVLNDYWGNVLGTISSGVPSWNPIRVGSYGPVLGYQAPMLNASAPLVDTLVWRSRRMDPTGFYWLGARYYDPMAGRFISADPAGHAASWDLYSFCNGDPLNKFDPTGRFGKGVAYGAGDVLNHYSTSTENFFRTVLSPVVGLLDPVAAKSFGTPVDEGPSASIYLNNSFASQLGYGVGYYGTEAAIQVGMMVATEGFGVASEAAATRLESMAFTSFEARSMLAADWEAAQTVKMADAVKVDFGVTQSYLPYRAGINYSFNTFNDSLGISSGTAGSSLQTGGQLSTAFSDLGRFRSELGGIPAKGGALPNGGTLARLDSGGKSFYGMNAHGQPTLIGNNFNSGHAEIDSLQQAFLAGKVDSKATMYVDNQLCRYCRRIDGLPQAVKDIGMDELIVHDPVNSWRVTPSGTVQIPRPE